MAAVSFLLHYIGQRIIKMNIMQLFTIKKRLKTLIITYQVLALYDQCSVPFLVMASLVEYPLTAEGGGFHELRGGPPLWCLDPFLVVRLQNLNSGPQS